MDHQKLERAITDIIERHVGTGEYDNDGVSPPFLIALAHAAECWRRMFARTLIMPVNCFDREFRQLGRT